MLRLLIILLLGAVLGGCLVTDSGKVTPMGANLYMATAPGMSAASATTKALEAANAYCAHMGKQIETKELQSLTTEANTGDAHVEFSCN